MAHTKKGGQASVSLLALAVLLLASGVSAASVGDEYNGSGIESRYNDTYSFSIKAAGSVSLRPGEKAPLIITLENNGDADVGTVALSSVPNLVSFSRNNVSIPSRRAVNLSAVVSAPRQEGVFRVAIIARAGRSTESAAISVRSSRVPSKNDSSPKAAGAQVAATSVSTGSQSAPSGSQPALSYPVPPVPAAGPTGMALVASRTSSAQGSIITLLGVLVLACIVLSESPGRPGRRGWSAAWGRPEKENAAA